MVVKVVYGEVVAEAHGISELLLTILILVEVMEETVVPMVEVVAEAHGIYQEMQLDFLEGMVEMVENMVVEVVLHLQFIQIREIIELTGLVPMAVLVVHMEAMEAIIQLCQKMV